MPLEPSGVPSRAGIQAAIDEVVEDLPVAMAAGSVTVSLAAAASGSVAVTFPAGRFTVAPSVQVSMGNNGGSAQFVARSFSPSTAGVTVIVYMANGAAFTGSVLVNWFAVQMTETTAAG